MPTPQNARHLKPSSKLGATITTTTQVKKMMEEKIVESSLRTFTVMHVVASFSSSKQKENQLEKTRKLTRFRLARE